MQNSVYKSERMQKRISRELVWICTCLPISYAETDHGQHNDNRADDQLEFFVLLLVFEACVLVVQGYVHVAQNDVQIFAWTREDFGHISRALSLSVESIQPIIRLITSVTMCNGPRRKVRYHYHAADRSVCQPAPLSSPSHPARSF